MELKDALIEHQFDEPQELVFKFLPNRLVDRAYCDSLSTGLLRVCGNNWEKKIATKTLSAQLPNLPGIYMFVWKPYFKFKFDDATAHFKYIVYIGKAGGVNNFSTLKSRYQSEYSKLVKCKAANIWNQSELKTRAERLDKYLNLWELEFWFIVMQKENCQLVEKYEDRLIKLFNPPGNRSGLRAKYGERKPAF